MTRKRVILGMDGSSQADHWLLSISDRPPRIKGTIMNVTAEGLRIVAASKESLPEINALIARSKAHWPWDARYLERALPLHRLDAAYLGDNHCLEVRDQQGQLVAFVAVATGDARVLLDNLWVTPDLIGRGIGRFACAHVLALARRQGWNTLWVLPDQPAAGFYLKMGFSDTGERVASRVQGGPVFPVYRIDL